VLNLAEAHFIESLIAGCLKYGKLLNTCVLRSDVSPKNDGSLKLE
jgi:hypothetical protein